MAKKKPPARFKQALVSYRKGDLAVTEQHCLAILSKSPKHTDTLNLLANVAIKQGEHRSAIDILRQIVKLAPGNYQYHYNLAFASMQVGDTVSSLDSVKRCIELEPKCGDAWNLLCAVSGRAGDLTTSLEAGLRAVDLLPQSAKTHQNLGATYKALNRLDDAIIELEKALALDEGDIESMESLANLYVSLGDGESAGRLFREIIKRQPTAGFAYRQLARLKYYEDCEDPDIAAFDTVLQLTGIAEGERSHLHFALGKMYEDCGDYGRSFHHLQKANDIIDRSTSYDPETLDSYLDAIIDTFDRQRIDSMHGLSSCDAAPIFLIGMPRSGSSLLEQILSSHPDVFGAGEAPWFARLERSVEQLTQYRQSYPRCVGLLDSGAIDALANAYLKEIAVMSAGQPYRRFTDKYLGNYLNIGMIRILFPHAKIVYCRRDPRDLCLSMYGLYVPDSIPFAYDLEKLGKAYLQFERMMNHWLQIFDNDIHIVDYEILVDKQESVTRALLEYLELPWDDTCLRFYENRRSVRTLTAFQIRQPMYCSSVGRWRNYESDLKPLLDVLDRRG